MCFKRLSKMVDRTQIRKQVSILQHEHRGLDLKIFDLEEDSNVSNVQVQRLKKEKLRLKDQIIKLQSLLLPDIIA